MNYSERRALVDWLNQVELDYPVNSWVVNGVKIWPLIKMHLFFSIFYPAIHNRSTWIRLKLFLKRMWLAVRGISAFFFRLQLKFLKAPVVFAGAGAHRVTYQDFRFNRYFDPMLDFLEENQVRSYLFEYQGESSNVYKPGRVVELEKLFPYFYCRSFFHRGVIQNKESLDKVIFAASEKWGISVPEVEKSLKERVDQVFAWSNLFHWIFSKTQPEYSVGLCYYKDQMLGMNLACSRLGIKSVDMQHGLSGDLHAAYSGFNRAPDIGYELLPDIFWTWDAGSSTCINNWISRTGTRFHKVVQGGNPWIEYLMSDPALERAVKLPEDIIVYALQPVYPIIEDHIMVAIKKTAGKYNWWLRLHPRSSQAFRDDLERLLLQHEIFDKVEVALATSLPLPFIFKNTVAHISKFSGTIIEASICGVISIIVDELGVESSQDQIESGKAFSYLGDDADAVISLIEACSEKCLSKLSNVTYKDVMRGEFQFIKT